MSDIEVAEVVEEKSIVRQDELSIDQLVAQVHKIQQAMSSVMKDNEHYGVIPGTNKPTLLKPGAEKLCLLFRLAPEYGVKETWHDDHFTVIATCRLNHITTGNFVAAGEGMCSTKESKYAYRTASRKCPACGSDAIIKGKAEYGGGWLCFKRKNGCGQKFNDNEPAIVNQPQGRVPNEDIPDSYNTVLKMACKRALIAAVLNGTAASDIFTQDVGDTEVEPEPVAPVVAESEKSEPAVAGAHPEATRTPSSSSEGGEAAVWGSDVAEPSSGDNPLKILLQGITTKKVTQSDILRKAAEITGKSVSRKELGTLPEGDLERLATELGLMGAAV